MSKKLFVGNLSFNTTEDEVRELFSEHGTIESLAWITDRDTGRFRGFCFIEMEDSAATNAISALDGQEFQGRGLRVNEAQPREERSGGGGGRRGGGGFNRGGGDRGGDRGGGSRGGGGYNRGGGSRGGGDRGGSDRGGSDRGGDRGYGDRNW